jgi:YgiT-type zinc finger domain-containing protein
VVCDVCGKEGARIRRVSETFGKGSDLLVIENVPLVTCPHCGESYFTADTLHELERIKLHRQTFAVECAVNVAKFVA